MVRIIHTCPSRAPHTLAALLPLKGLSDGPHKWGVKNIEPTTQARHLNFNRATHT
jgi:hypothetical protein